MNNCLLLWPHLCYVFCSCNSWFDNFTISNHKCVWNTTISLKQGFKIRKTIKQIENVIVSWCSKLSKHFYKYNKWIADKSKPTSYTKGIHECNIMYLF